jgi:hypothetical protein
VKEGRTKRGKNVNTNIEPFNNLAVTLQNP